MPSPACRSAIRRARAWPALALAALLLALPARADTDADVRASFQRYVAALAARDGLAAVTLVTPTSLAHQERLRDLALRAPRAEVQALPMADRLMVLRLRHEFTAAELRPLSGADLLRIAVDEAWNSPKPLQVLTIAGVEEGRDTAIASVTRAGEPVPLRLVFHQDPNGWRLDLVELARVSDAPLAATLTFRAGRAKVDLDAALRWAIEDTSGHLVDKDLWLPLARSQR